MIYTILLKAEQKYEVSDGAAAIAAFVQHIKEVFASRDHACDVRTGAISEQIELNLYSDSAVRDVISITVDSCLFRRNSQSQSRIYLCWIRVCNPNRYHLFLMQHQQSLHTLRKV